MKIFMRSNRWTVALSGRGVCSQEHLGHPGTWPKSLGGLVLAVAGLVVPALISADVVYTRLHSFGPPEWAGTGPQGSLVQGIDGALYGSTGDTVFKLDPCGTGYTVLHTFSGGADGYWASASLVEGTDGAFYGTTWGGGSADRGTVFKLDPDGTGYAILHNFTGADGDGAEPYTALVQGTDGALYGTTRRGGSADGGTAFKLNPDGTGYTILYNFTGGDGGVEINGLVQGRDGALYGTTEYGGSEYSGTVFKINPDGTGYAVLHDFHWFDEFDDFTDGNWPSGLVQGSDGALYGTTRCGGSAHRGTVFKLNPDGTHYTILHAFTGGSGDGSRPTGLVQGGDGALYGTTGWGGSAGRGTVFTLSSDGTRYTILHSFTSNSDGRWPNGLIKTSDGALYGTTELGGSADAGTVFTLDPNDGSYAILYEFTGVGSDGIYPSAGLVQGNDGVLYSTTCCGGRGGGGTVFKLNPDGTGYAILVNVTPMVCTCPGDPRVLLQGTAGALYGITGLGDLSHRYGVFTLNPDGTGYAILDNFTASDDVQGLVQGIDGVLYGTTSFGGSASSGTVFKLNPDDTGYAIIHSFAPTSDGYPPYPGRLIQGNDGALYGTTSYGSSGNAGTVFKLNPDGTGYAILHNFDDYWSPEDLVQGTDGALYGTTQGTVFKLNPDGTGYTILHDLFLARGLVQGRDGALYGTDESTDAGTVFKLNPDGTGYTILYSFTGGEDGNGPNGLVQGSDGAFYGTTYAGGDMGYGTVFRIAINDTPTLQCPPAVTLPCSPPSGLNVNVPVVVSDPDGNALTVSWDVDGTVLSVPAARPPTAATVAFTHLFTPGTHTLNITVSDGMASASCQTTLTIEADITLPTLVSPADLRVEFDSKSGAVVQFPALEAMDDCSGQVAMQCVPASGSTFPIGNTVVVCTATDAAGNQSACQFVVTVVGPRQVLEGVAVDLARLEAGTTDSKDRKQLGEAIERLNNALDPAQWVDETHLLPQHGQRVFQELKGAVQRLEVLTKDKHSQIPDAAVQDLNGRIAKSARFLAAVDVANGAPSLRARFHRGQLAR